MNIRELINWKVFWILLSAGIFTNAAVLPYALSLAGLHEAGLPVPLPIAVLVQIIQAAVLFAIMIFIGLLLGAKVGLGVPLVADWVTRKSTKGRLRPLLTLSCTLGVVTGISIFLMDRFVFAFFVEPITASQAAPPLWQRVLASFYGGIGEEIAMRLFLMTLVVWIIFKFCKPKDNKLSDLGFWVAIIFASCVFGLGHLPMTALFVEITPIVVTRAIVLNGIAGIVFGWLYWRKGLEAAMISHFSADIALHVSLPLLF